MKRFGVFALAAASFLTACGGGQTQGSAFDPNWSNDEGASIDRFRRDFASRKVPLQADVAVGVVGNTTLVGASLASGKKWTYEHALDSRPAVAGSVVVGLGHGELFALDSGSGSLLWKRNSGGMLRGIGDDGRTTVVSLVAPTGQGSIVLALNHDGEVIRQIEEDASIGVPAVVDGYAFFPWQRQYVTVYDIQNGDEKARVLLRSLTSRAFATGGSIFFGEIAATRFDDQIRLAPRNNASSVALPARELPGTPKWMRSGLEVLPVRSSALDSARLYARPVSSGPIGIDSNRFVATYYRLAIGLDAKSGAVAWVHSHDAEFLGGAAYEGGFALCDDKGKVTFLDAKTGGSAGQMDLGQPLASCVVQADALTKPPAPSPGPLAEQFAKAVSMPQAEHVMAQRLLLREMATLEDARVTGALIDLAWSAATPPMLVEDARKYLAARRTGADLMLAALEKKYDFLADRLRPPPVGPIADALAALGEKRAAPLLVEHLGDPADTLDDMERAARALFVLASKEQLPGLAMFFAQYRGVATDEQSVNAIASVAQVLTKLDAGAQVRDAIEDASTTPVVKERLRILSHGAKQKSGDGDKTSSQTSAPKASPEKGEPKK